MLKERIQEVFEFTKSESPYRKANKGWINKDIFLDLSPNLDRIKQKNEAAKVTLFWSPISSLLSNIFLIVILGSILVFTSVSLVDSRFDFNSFNNIERKNILKVDENNILKLKDVENLDSKNLTINENFETTDIEKSNKISSLEVDLNKADEQIINNKIDEEESLINEGESKKDIKVLKNRKQKSNFI